jgi:hypothetical protein
MDGRTDRSNEPARQKEKDRETEHEETKTTGWKKMKIHAPFFTEMPLNTLFIATHYDMTKFSEAQ